MLVVVSGGSRRTAPAAAAGGGFATPDIVNHASFETNASEGGIFTDGGAGSPSWTQGTLHPTRGTHSVSMAIVPTDGVNDVGNRNNWVNWTNSPISHAALDDVYIQFDVYSTVVIDGVLKFVRTFRGDTNNNFGGLEMESGHFSVWTDRENISAGYVTSIGQEQADYVNTSLNIEMHYMRNGHISGWPMMEFWFNKTKVGRSNGSVGAGLAFWDSLQYFSGERNSPGEQLGAVQFLATLNGGPANSTTGTQYIDNVSISTQRIG